MTRLEQIRERLKAIKHTGDWGVEFHGSYWQVETGKYNLIAQVRHRAYKHHIEIWEGDAGDNISSDEAVARFVSASKADVEYLVEQIDSLTKLNAKLNEKIFILRDRLSAYEEGEE